MKFPLFLLLILAILFSSCAIFPKQAHLTAEEKDFLSTVRYIITSQERKTFLSLSTSERQAFIEDFWKKRDPTPETEVNEYKNEYYRRVEEAKRLFTEGGTSGWLQDRGRIYILLGPPEQREQYPRGYTFYGFPTEIWHYGFHRLIFVDTRWNGNFELQPESARLLAEINTAQMQLKPAVRQEDLTQNKAALDLRVEVKKILSGKIALSVFIPYKDIWFSSEKGKLETTLEVVVDIFDLTGKKILSRSQSQPLSLTKKELKDLFSQDLILEIPLALESGEYNAKIVLKNETGKGEIKKEFQIKF
ncbi:MAG: GWxTD domain-containing protein [Candidatus Aminicenantales bacterium]